MGYIEDEHLIFVNNHPYMHVGDGEYLPAVYGGAEDNDELIKVQNFIKEQVRGYFDELKDKLPAPQPMVTRQSDQEIQQQQLREIISPFIEPGLNEARLHGADAKDYVKFYTSNPEAAEYADEVEKLFEGAVKAGRPIPRQDLLDYVIGKEYRSDRDKFTEKLTSKKKEQVERAESASDIGSFSMTKAKNDPMFAAFTGYERLEGDDLSNRVKEMEKALEGVTF